MYTLNKIYQIWDKYHNVIKFFNYPVDVCCLILNYELVAKDLSRKTFDHQKRIYCRCNCLVLNNVHWNQIWAD